MEIFVNHKKVNMKEGLSIEDLLLTLGIKNRFIAVEVNCEIIPKSKYNNFCLKESDKVEIIKPIGGG